MKNIWSKEFWKASISRAVKTITQTALALIGTTTVLTGVNWELVISTSLMSGILSLLTSISFGIPEVKDNE